MKFCFEISYYFCLSFQCRCLVWETECHSLCIRDLRKNSEVGILFWVARAISSYYIDYVLEFSETCTRILRLVYFSELLVPFHPIVYSLCYNSYEVLIFLWCDGMLISLPICIFILQFYCKSAILDPHTYCDPRATDWMCSVQCHSWYLHAHCHFISIIESVIF